MDKMKKILSSPITRKRNVPGSGGGGGGGKYFGVPLEEILKREASLVPRLVQKICSHIQQHGMQVEGIFRVNGNSRVLEKLKSSFNRTGDADLEEAGDIMAVAGLLKLFLRELPDAIIPDHMTSLFVSAQEECLHDHVELLRRIKLLLDKLPRQYYEVLKFLSRFLVLVSLQEQTNKMSPMALGIVFGPNLFRCAGGIEGLKQQGTTNQIVLHFIKHYDQLFLQPGEISPYHTNLIQSKMRHDSSLSHESDASDDSHMTPRSLSETTGTPRFSDDEFMDTFRSSSPFVLDSDRSEGVASPMMNTVAVDGPPWMVEKTISSAVAQHLFGDASTSFSSDEGAHKETPKPAPRRKRKEKSDRIENGNDDDDDDDQGKENRPEVPRPSVKQRIQLFEADDEDVEDSRDSSKHNRQRPKSKAFELFETQGIIIGPAPGKLPKKEDYGEDSEEDSEEDIMIDPNDDLPSAESSPISRPVPRPRGNKRKPHNSEGSLDEGLDSVHTSSQDSVHSTLDSDDSGFGSIQRANPTLTSFKRPAGPRNRRTPSRHSLRKVLDPTDAMDMLDHIKETDHEMDTYDRHDEMALEQFRNGHSDGSSGEEEDMVEDVNHNATKPSISFLDIHHNGTTDSFHSPEKSPSVARKPYIPPLDLSILHEHGDGSDPIPAEQGPSLSIHKAKSLNEEDVMLSPRMSKLKKKVNIRTHDDDHTALVKQLTRKIQSCKRKIKIFEENYEGEYGYRPSQADKAGKPEIKKSIQELAKARKELKRLKEEMHSSSERLDSQFDMSPVSSGWADTPSADGELNSPTVEETLDILHKRLAEKRREAVRPQDLVLMSREQIQEEKLAVQKALLQYESLHGRPTTKNSKELMKPMYDRYRSIKRMLSKPISPREKAKELQSVPEDQTIEFPTPSTASARTPTMEVVRVPTAQPEAHPIQENTTDFLVTQNLGLLKDTLRTVDRNAQPDLSPEGPGPSSWKANLHELTVPQLFEEQNKSRIDKKRLRKVLREFEDEFFRQNARKVQKEDRSPMETEYQEYKQIKARLKLLDALLSKHDPTYVI